MNSPIVSVVIPTRNRPDTLFRAIYSVQAQTISDFELIVVIDGADDKTRNELSRLKDNRIRVIALLESVGGAEARNIGVKNAAADWIALLDDDDEWFPQKLEAQLRIAQNSKHPFPIIGCRMIVHTPSGAFVLPRRFPYENEHISEYLMSRRSIFHGEGLLQTSMLFMKKDLLLRIPFTKGLLRHHETDFIIRAFLQNGVGLEMSDEILGVWYKDDNRSSVSKTGGWEYSLNWVKDRKNNITNKAYISFVLTAVTPIAINEGVWSALPKIIKEAISNGKPSFYDLIIFVAMFVIPKNFRVKLRTFVLRHRCSVK